MVQLAIVEIVMEVLRELQNKKTMKEALQGYTKKEDDRVFRNKNGRVWYWRKIVEYLRLVRAIL